MAMLICALCLLIAAGLFAQQAIRQWRARVLVARRLQGRLARAERLEGWLHWLGSSPWGSGCRSSTVKARRCSSV